MATSFHSIMHFIPLKPSSISRRNFSLGLVVCATLIIALSLPLLLRNLPFCLPPLEANASTSSPKTVLAHAGQSSAHAELALIRLLAAPSLHQGDANRSLPSLPPPEISDRPLNPPSARCGTPSFDSANSQEGD